MTKNAHTMDAESPLSDLMKWMAEAQMDNPRIDISKVEVIAFDGPLAGDKMLRWEVSSLKEAMNVMIDALEALPQCKVTVQVQVSMTVDSSPTFRDRNQSVGHDGPDYSAF